MGKLGAIITIHDVRPVSADCIHEAVLVGEIATLAVTRIIKLVKDDFIVARITISVCRGIEPTGNTVERRKRTWVVRVNLAVFILHFDRSVVVLAKQFWIEANGNVLAVSVLVRRHLLVQFVILQERHANRENTLDQLLIQIERIANRAPVVDAIFVIVSRFERSVIDARVDDTGRAANAEKNRVWSALKIDATHVETVPR